MRNDNGGGDEVAEAIRYAADHLGVNGAVTPQGALEIVSGSLERIADAISGQDGENIGRALHRIADGLSEVASAVSVNYRPFEMQIEKSADYLGSAVEEIDKQFGEGYAKEHPELVGAFMQVAANDRS